MNLLLSNLDSFIFKFLNSFSLLFCFLTSFSFTFRTLNTIYFPNFQTEKLIIFKMTDFIINNPITLRGCILYEFTKGKAPFRTYQKLMKKLGDDFMTYPEFDYSPWLYSLWVYERKWTIQNLQKVNEDVGRWLHDLSRIWVLVHEICSGKLWFGLW